MSEIETLSFEQALAELEKIVGELESGQAPRS
jgi:exodeoxyribonuclease VII small subunit